MNPIQEHRPDEWRLYEPLHGTRMLELGGKWCSQTRSTYKAVFLELGFEHVSVDWNGEHGALRLDLQTPLWHDLGVFDMVCNMGTTEHVSAQAGVWKNIHMMTKPHGVYVGQTPYHDGKSWWWHGEWYPTEQWYEDFAAKNHWVIERMYRDREPPNENLYVRMRKQDHVTYTDPDYTKIKRNIRRPR